MKNVFKILGIIALVAVIGFGFVGCGGDDDNNNNNTANANVSISVFARYYLGTGSSTDNYFSIGLILPSGAKWTLPEEGASRRITDAQALAAIKSWVAITSDTTPAITGWDFNARYSEDDYIFLHYSREGTGVSRSNVTVQIDQSKVSEMKSYTNVTGTLTASSETVTKGWTREN